MPSIGSKGIFTFILGKDAGAETMGSSRTYSHDTLSHACGKGREKPNIVVNNQQGQTHA